MNIDPKKLAEEATAKVSGIGGNVLEQAKDKLGDVVESIKEKTPDSIKEKAADFLGDIADKLKH